MSATNLPDLLSYQATDGNHLYYRHYEASNPGSIVILLHGIGEDSKYLEPLAAYLSSENLAHVFTPDLRGYGENPIRRGDLDYIGQQEEDIAELIKQLKKTYPSTKVILAGHSAGGGTFIRFADSKFASLVDKYLLLSPFVHFQAPIMKKTEETEKNKVWMGRLIKLMLLNKLGFTKQNHLPIYRRFKPEELFHGTETLTLSYRLFMSRIPDNYKKALANLPESTLLLIGDQDEEFDHTKYEPLFTKYSTTTPQVIADTDHNGILFHPDSLDKIKNWITD
ncbi:alpha/beta hydrolase [Aquibacillus albus]|uniref:Alpha-beta hydrolase superfamily lysophospholipase n=1 Tax=Aquibacillus albus TaxID=1168171 RepID=A0ABS2MXC5_9BACI|nr:alpha/beta hydrolase [Aquibacillus albus]MBM7570546.1 alpha-beta hydrolase superfamily lysophospholipase [Aquibacillus albus]